MSLCCSFRPVYLLPGRIFALTLSLPPPRAGCRPPLEYKYGHRKVRREARRLWEKEDRLNKGFGGKPGVGLKFSCFLHKARAGNGCSELTWQRQGERKWRLRPGDQWGHRRLKCHQENGILLFIDGNSLLFCIVLCLSPLGIWHNYSSFLSGGSHCVYQLWQVLLECTMSKQL